MQELDPRIYQLADTPDVIAERGERMQAAQEKVRQMRQAAQDAQATRQAFQQFTDPQTGITDYQRVIGQLMRTNPVAGQNAIKLLDDHREKIQLAEKQHYETEEAKGKILSGIASSISSQADLNAAREAYHPELAQALPDAFDDAGKARLKQLEQAGLTGAERNTRAHNAFEEALATLKFGRDTPDFIEKASRSAAAIFSNLSVDDGTAFLKSATTLGFPSEAITPLFSKTPEEAAQMALTPNERAVRAQAAKSETDLNTYRTAELGIRRQEASLAQQREKRLEQAGQPGQPGSTGALTAEGVDYAATQYRITGVMPPMGMGNGPARAAIINRAAEQARTLGLSPAAAIQKTYATRADADSLKKIRVMETSAEAFENKALQQADLISGLSKKVSRTQFPVLNSALLAGKKEVLGDSDTQLLYNAILSFTNEYAKILEGSTGSVAAASESARMSAAKLISPALNKGTLEDTLSQMKREMQFTLDGYNATIDHITTRMGGTLPVEPAAPAPAQTPAAAAPKKVGKYTIIEHK